MVKSPKSKLSGYMRINDNFLVYFNVCFRGEVILSKGLGVSAELEPYTGHINKIKYIKVGPN